MPQWKNGKFFVWLLLWQWWLLDTCLLFGLAFITQCKCLCVCMCLPACTLKFYMEVSVCVFVGLCAQGVVQIIKFYTLNQPTTVRPIKRFTFLLQILLMIVAESQFTQRLERVKNTFTKQPNNKKLKTFYFFPF